MEGINMHSKFVIGVVVVIVLFSALFVISLGMENPSTDKNTSANMVKDTDPVIRIDNDSEFDAAHGVRSGSGTLNDPYIISDWVIDAQGAGNAIYVGNTTKYFVIENCTIYNATHHNNPYFYGGGIGLINVENATVRNNIIHNNSYNIYINSAENLVIFNNTLADSWWESISAYKSSHLTIKNNTLYRSIQGSIHLWDTTYAKLYSNEMHHGGVMMWGTQDSFMTHNIPLNNTVNGKPVYYYKNADMNNIRVPLDAGQVILGNVKNMRIENLSFDYTSTSIEIGYSSDIKVRNNTVSHGWRGILFYHTDSSLIWNNTVSDSDRKGLYLFTSSNNKIDNNTISYSAWDGISLNSYSDANTLTGNMLVHNRVYGIRIQSGASNVIYNNSFYYNHYSGDTYSSSSVQAYDDSTHNEWSHNEKGNYWHDWANNNNTNDQNPPYGIVDWPYKLDGSANAEDPYPLTSGEPIPELSPVFVIFFVALAILLLVHRKRQ